MDIWCVHASNQFLIKCQLNPTAEIMSLKDVFCTNKLYYKDNEGIYIIIQDDEDINVLIESPIKILYIGKDAINYKVNENLLYSSIFGNCSVCEQPITCTPHVLKCTHKIHPNCLFGSCMLCSTKCQKCNMIINNTEYLAHVQAHPETEEQDMKLKLEEEQKKEYQSKLEIEESRKLEEQKEKEKQIQILLEKKRKEEEQRKSIEEANICVICLVTIEDADRYFLPCSHRFHKNCILQWLALSNMCPICRQNPEEMINNPKFN